VKKLFAAGFIKPIQHPLWLSNIVPVKKKNGQIRCCVNFRNLNKSCPKDEFPLPNVDLLIDSAAGHAMFSFVDRFSGYNQIRISTKDAEKTAFRIPIGNFYYTVMPFGLKNAGATYQRIMTAMFHDMMNKEIEDYVDDIVVKSKKREDHLETLRKVFDRFRLYKLKMNPLKCVFGVFVGKFLGFLVHNRGIDVDPAKASAITTMKAPTSHKELKSFLGRLSYIRRFIPGLAIVTATFTSLMKKGVPFVWSTACQQAFEKIQVIMTKLPIVCASVAGRPLCLYLSSNSQAIGALVAQEDESGTEKPVYYVSRTLRDAGTRYSGAERACLALIYASQRLRHYFLAHKIQLMTKSHPIRSLLYRPILSGRLAQWLLQLSQYEIITETPMAIKSQAIVDLLAQFPGEDSSSISHEVPGGVGETLLADLVDSIWTLKFDGSSTSSSSRVGIVLIKEDGETIAKSFKLDFSCSNNASEYEANITRLPIAHEMGIKHLRVIGDSNLVICQTKGEFSLKEPSLAPYCALAQKLEEKFDTFEVSHAMRCGNRYADALATLGSQISFEGPKVDVTINKRSMPITDLLKEEFEEQCHDAEDWWTPIKAKLMSLEGVADLKTLKDYVLIAGDLYRRLPGGVLARCVSLREAAKKLTKVHERSCEFRDGVSLYRRLQRLGYFWPNMSKEATNLQEQCSFCQHQHESDQVYATFISSDWRTPFLEYFIENVLPQTSKAAI
jgi:ribonuclease HI